MWDDIVEEPPWSVYDQDPLTALVRRQDGIISGRQARAHLSAKALRHRVASGRWRRVHRAIFQVYGGSITQAQRRWIAVLAAAPDPRARSGTFGAGHGAYLGGLTALCTSGLRGITGHGVHLAVPHGRQIRLPDGVVAHRVRELPEEDCHPAAQPPVTLPGRSLIDAAQWARSDAEARLIIAASFQQRLVRVEELTTILGRRLLVNRRGLIIRTVWDCATGSHSLAELELLQLCRHGGLPLPSRQFRHRDESGRLRYLDACFDEFMVAVEVDGAQHWDVGQMWDDHERQNDLSLSGYSVLRYPGWVVREQPERVLSQLRRALRAAGWRDPSSGESRAHGGAPDSPNAGEPNAGEPYAGEPNAGSGGEVGTG